MGAAAVPQADPEAASAQECPSPAPQGEDAEETAAINAHGGLTEAQLLEIFKQTSIFNVRSAMAGNEVLMGCAAQEEDERCVKPPLSSCSCRGC